MDLPEDFLIRMQTLLGVEAELFFHALEQSAFQGLRVNSLKTSPDQMMKHSGWQLPQIPWCKNGLFVDDRLRPGKHPFHHAGLYYIQEPSAMAVAEVVAPQPGELILDIAAAPGGKSTHLAALSGNGATIIANEFERKRTQALTTNLERWGATDAIILNEKTERIAQRWDPIFDLVLVDAPCSGEGMFRKDKNTRREWSMANVLGCQQRQENLLRQAAQLVRPGGVLVYSTCTFNPEENEQVIANFLRDFADYQLLPIVIPGASPGRPKWVANGPANADLTQTCRLWPHQIEGEGHFIAKMQRDEYAVFPLPRHRLKSASKAPIKMWQEFAMEHLKEDLFATRLFIEIGERLFSWPQKVPSTDQLHVLRGGVCLGTIKKNRFEPDHALALALPRNTVTNQIDLDCNDPQIVRYLQGQTLSNTGTNGWTLVTVNGHGIGWGKQTNGTLKNYYPKGLRLGLD